MTAKVYDQREDLYAARRSAPRTAQEQAAVQLYRCADCIGACKMAGFDAFLCARKAWPENFLGPLAALQKARTYLVDAMEAQPNEETATDLRNLDAAITTFAGVGR